MEDSMSNYVEYQKSVSSEFEAYKNRVRNIIGGSHWGEEGRHKEVVLMNYLKRVLPSNISIGTGFVKSNRGITKQIDIIIYDSTYPMFFSEGDFAIVIPESVLGIIEVKSNIRNGEDLKEYINKANYNAEVICGNEARNLFNGIFSYDGILSVDAIANNIEQLDYSDILKKESFNQPYSNRLLNCVNHIVYSDKTFIKMWNHYLERNEVYYSIYEMPNKLSIGYFISNLQEFVYRYTKGRYLEELPDGLKDFFYPLPEGKEPYIKAKAYIKKGE